MKINLRLNSVSGGDFWIRPQLLCCFPGSIPFSLRRQIKRGKQINPFIGDITSVPKRKKTSRIPELGMWPIFILKYDSVFVV